MIPIRTITINASRDDLTEQDYRDIFEEFREKYSLRAFVELAKSGYSIAYWSKYERGEFELTRQAKNEMRRAVGLPALPLTVAESVADVDAGAGVIEIGAGPKNRRRSGIR